MGKETDAHRVPLLVEKRFYEMKKFLTPRWRCMSIRVYPHEDEALQKALSLQQFCFDLECPLLEGGTLIATKGRLTRSKQRYHLIKVIVMP